MSIHCGRGRDGTGSGNGWNKLNVAEVVGLARRRSVAVANRRRAHAPQSTCNRQNNNCVGPPTEGTKRTLAASVASS